MLKLIAQTGPGSPISDAMVALQLTGSVPAALLAVVGPFLLRGVRLGRFTHKKG